MRDDSGRSIPARLGLSNTFAHTQTTDKSHLVQVRTYLHGLPNPVFSTSYPEPNAGNLEPPRSRVPNEIYVHCCAGRDTHCVPAQSTACRTVHFDATKFPRTVQRVSPWETAGSALAIVQTRPTAFVHSGSTHTTASLLDSAPLDDHCSTRTGPYAAESWSV